MAPARTMFDKMKPNEKAKGKVGSQGDVPTHAPGQEAQVIGDQKQKMMIQSW